MSVTSLFLQTISLIFRSYLAQKLGAEGLGLFQLTMSVNFLSVTLATSGVRFTTTSLVAEELGVGRQAGAEKAVRSCFLYAIAFGLASMTLLNLSAKWIGTVWLHDTRTVLSLRIFAFSLPLISTSSVLSGYLIAARKAPDTAAAQILEELIEVGAGVFFLRLFLPLGLEYACAAVILGSVMGEVGSFLLQLAFFRAAQRGRGSKSGSTAPALSRRLFRIAVPVACSAYLSAGFRMVEQLLIPYGLKKSGSTGSAALSTFGVIQGMVMPLIMLPALLLGTILELILPELAGCRAAGHTKRLNYMIDRVFRIGILFSMCTMWIFLRFSNELGTLIYQNKDAAYFIRMLAALVPFFYLDMIVDTILKSIGKQLSTMRHNLFTSSISILLLYLLLPRYAINGYLIAVYSTKILNFICSLNRLVRDTDLSVSFFSTLKSIFCIIGATSFTDLFMRLLPAAGTSVSVISQVLLIVFFYLFFLRMFSCISHEDIEWGRSLLK